MAENLYRPQADCGNREEFSGNCFLVMCIAYEEDFEVYKLLLPSTVMFDVGLSSYSAGPYNTVVLKLMQQEF